MLKIYFFVFVAGLVSGFLLNLSLFPEKYSKAVQTDTQDHKGTEVSTLRDFSLNNTIKHVEKSDHKTVITNPKFDAYGRIVGGSQAIIYEKPSTEIDSTKIISDNQIIHGIITETKTKAEQETLTIERNLRRFSLGFQLPIGQLATLTPDIRDARVEGGMRIFNTPLWLTTGFDFQTRQMSSGFRVEF